MIKKSLKTSTTLYGESMNGKLPSRNRSFSVETIYVFVTKYSKTGSKCNTYYLFSRQVLITNNYEKLLVYLTFMASSVCSHG